MIQPLHRFFLLAHLLLLMGLWSCGGERPASSGGVEPRVSNAEQPPALPAADDSASEGALVGETGGGREARSSSFDFSPGGPVSDEQLGGYHVIMGTSIDGEDLVDMTFEFWPEAAPITVRNFLRLVDQGFYDELTFHRVVRNFMVQGGCAKGDGTGTSPLGMIKGEFHTEEKWRHQYGVLSMARLGPDTAGSQIFIINDDGPGAWSLDGKYASFGRMTSGVAALEALSDISVVPNPMSGELSKPTANAVIRFARVVEGAAPTGEEIVRPAVALDLGGAPERVSVHSMLIGMAGGGTRATRTGEEAEALANELVGRLRAGEDFETLGREFSDDPLQVGLGPDEEFFGFHLLNHGVKDMEGQRRIMKVNEAAQWKAKGLAEQQAAGTITREELTTIMQSMQRDLMIELRSSVGLDRNQLGSQWGIDAVAFELEVGEVGLVATSPQKSRNGWYVIQRVK